MEKEVKATRKIGIYGSELTIEAIAAGLQEKPGFTVQRIAELPLDLAGETEADLPDLVLFDLNMAPPRLAITLMHKHPKIMAIGIDLAKHTMLVVSGKELGFLTEEDLVQAIELQALERERI